MACYIRRLTKGNTYNNGVIHGAAFRCRPVDEGLSFHRLTEGMTADRCEAYCDHHGLPSGDKPGVCVLCDEDFVAAGLALPSPDPMDGPYGEDHMVFIPCPNDAQEAQLMELANLRVKQDGGLMREFICHRKGRKAFL